VKVKIQYIRVLLLMIHLLKITTSMQMNSQILMRLPKIFLLILLCFEMPSRCLFFTMIKKRRRRRIRRIKKKKEDKDQEAPKIEEGIKENLAEILAALDSELNSKAAEEIEKEKEPEKEEEKEKKEEEEEEEEEDEDGAFKIEGQAEDILHASVEDYIAKLYVCGLQVSESAKRNEITQQDLELVLRIWSTGGECQISRAISLCRNQFIIGSFPIEGPQ